MAHRFAETRAAWSAAMQRAALVSDARVFAFTMVWVIAGGLLLQGVVLPYLFPRLHWGFGLIAGGDWMSFHHLAAEQAERVRATGWSAWELRPGGQFPAGLASIFYLIYPQPWIMLPVNGAFFGLTVVTVRALLAATFGSPVAALAGIAPFFLFLSFVPIWGQLHKDVVGGAGFALVLHALVVSTRDGRAPRSGLLLAETVVGMVLVWLVRPYSVLLVGAAAVAYAVFAVFGAAGRRVRLAAVTAVVLVTAVLGAGPWSSLAITSDIPTDPSLLQAEEVTAAAALQAQSAGTPWPRTARLDPGVMAIEDSRLRYLVACAPPPGGSVVDRVLFALCFRREGFKADGADAGSNIDYDLRMRRISDYLAYAPRALQVAVLEPLPTRWGTEQSFFARFASILVPYEMLLAYASLLLALVFGWRRFVRAGVWAILAYCCAYTAVLVYVVPNIGTVYRMRAFAFAIIVSTALAAFVAHVCAPAPARPEA
jgi:hypothetical protein